MYLLHLSDNVEILASNGGSHTLKARDITAKEDIIKVLQRKILNYLYLIGTVMSQIFMIYYYY